MTETRAQFTRRLRRENVRRDGAREAIDAMVSRLMLSLPVSSPLDLLELADQVKADFAPVAGQRYGGME